MTKQSDHIEEVIEHNRQAKTSTRINEAGGRTVAEVLDTMRKYPGTKMEDVLHRMKGR